MNPSAKLNVMFKKKKRSNANQPLLKRSPYPAEDTTNGNLPSSEAEHCKREKKNEYNMSRIPRDVTPEQTPLSSKSRPSNT